ncbi:class I SAM-dependent methyltransferase [Chitinophaga solisilvae]|uniref:Class I SAM-dependent methyltransferase n=1 Tax=Chitinophaga solisilvae TaxID=1233460 RepID=A0A3S1AWL0_9BACT|nr:class I SAM-dependent methyltransferase [Chitinophaga solisilvae]NSL85480.1 class I SAM-dependent methyltransferase [Chitinophaga solisilvae]
MKNTERFSNRVDDYVKYRPQYPVAIIPYLQEVAGLTPSAAVADIGSGTGISAQPFLDNGNTVYAVEPNREMREMGERLLQRYPYFKSITGTAERTTLPDASVDLLIAGQSFHWFEREEARQEFRRIMRPGTSAVLMWNFRETDTPFDKAYEKLRHDFGIDYKDMKHRNIQPQEIARFFLPDTFHEKYFHHVQRLDYAAIKGLLLSSSYMPDKTHPRYNAMIQELEDVFEKHQENRMVALRYETKVFTGKL